MFLIMDGSSILTSAYYATLPRTSDPESAVARTSSGVAVNGIRAFLITLSDILRNHPEITHMAVFFDKSRDTFRRKLYPGYKANRGPKPKSLSQQMVHMEKILNAIGIFSASDPDFEADDMACTLVKKFESPDEPIVVMTHDGDWLQLISPYTLGWIIQPSQEKADAITGLYIACPEAMRFPPKAALFNRNTVKFRTGVWPEQIPDLKGLAGDTADNIPGVHSVGPKSAVPLLNRYHTVEGLYREINQIQTKNDVKSLNTEWKSLGISRSPLSHLIGQESIAMLSKNLATMRSSVPLPTNRDAYRLNISNKRLDHVIHAYELENITEYLYRKDTP